MARNKYPEVTVEKILEVSQRLFIEKGYDNTTIQDIVELLHGKTGYVAAEMLQYNLHCVRVAL